MIGDSTAASPDGGLAALEALAKGDYVSLAGMTRDPVGDILSGGGPSFVGDNNYFRTTFGGNLLASFGDFAAGVHSLFSNDGFGFNPISQTYLTPGESQDALFLGAATSATGPMITAAQKGLTTIKVVGRLQDITADAVDWVDSSLSNLLGELSPKRQAQYLRGSMQDALRGKAVESRARTLFGQDDFAPNYVELGSLNRGADLRFIDRPIWLDWTTQKAWQAHLDRGYPGYGVLLDTSK
jgi:hypothetical protein